MSCATKPWDSIRVKPPVATQPIGPGSFTTYESATMRVSSVTEHQARLRFCKYADRENDYYVTKRCCEELSEFFAELGKQLK